MDAIFAASINSGHKLLLNDHNACSFLRDDNSNVEPLLGFGLLVGLVTGRILFARLLLRLDS